MATRNQHSRRDRLVYELDLLSEAWHTMEAAKLRVVFNFLISAFMISAALYQGKNLDMAIIGATIVMGISFSEVRRAYIDAKKSNQQSTFE